MFGVWSNWFFTISGHVHCAVSGATPAPQPGRSRGIGIGCRLRPQSKITPSNIRMKISKASKLASLFGSSNPHVAPAPKKNGILIGRSGSGSSGGSQRCFNTRSTLSAPGRIRSFPGHPRDPVFVRCFRMMRIWRRSATPSGLVLD